MSPVSLLSDAGFLLLTWHRIDRHDRPRDNRNRALRSQNDRLSSGLCHLASQILRLVRDFFYHRGRSKVYGTRYCYSLLDPCDVKQSIDVVWLEYGNPHSGLYIGKSRKETENAQLIAASAGPA